MKIYAEIAGWGKCLPDRVLSNHDLEKMVDTSDEWIRCSQRHLQRHVVSENESTSTMAVAAAREAMERAGVGPADLDLIILATASPDYPSLPGTASLVQHELGAKRLRRLRPGGRLLRLRVRPGHRQPVHPVRRLSHRPGDRGRGPISRRRLEG